MVVGSPPQLSRHRIVRLVASIVVGSASLAASHAFAAPPCPELAGETITWIVPFGPGGGYDIYSRLIEPHLEAALGAEIAVINVEGAGGIVGTKRISEAPGDGLTLGLVNAAGLVTSRLLGDDTVPAPDRNLTVIATLTTGDRVWLVRSDGPIASVDDLFQTAEQRPIVLPVSDAGGAGFVGSAGTAALLGSSTNSYPDTLDPTRWSPRSCGMRVTHRTST